MLVVRPLPPSTAIHNVQLVQCTCLTVLVLSLPEKPIPSETARRVTNNILGRVGSQISVIHMVALGTDYKCYFFKQMSVTNRWAKEDLETGCGKGLPIQHVN